jgi:hypothetical protein
VIQIYEESYWRSVQEIVCEKNNILEAGEKINNAFMNPVKPVSKNSDDPLIQKLFEWVTVNYDSVNKAVKETYNAELICKLQGWESGLVPLTDKDIAEAFDFRI